MILGAMMCCRNEDWIAGFSLRAALMWNDLIVVLLHSCADRSAAIVEDVALEHPGRVYVIDDDAQVWDEMHHRQKMLNRARLIGCTHLSIVDLDEILTGNLLAEGPLGNNARQAAWLTGIEGNSAACQKILHLPGYNLRHGIQEYHSNGVWGNRWFSTAFQDDPRLSWSGDRFHHREPMGMPLQPYRPVKQGDGGVMHLWGASERRLIAKHRMYRIQERLRWPKKPVAEIEKMYSWATRGDPSNPAYGTPQTWTYSAVPDSWWAPYKHLMHHLDLEQVPWQEAWCDEMIETHGREWFAGLNVLGAV